jgi:hypothetical protein
MPPFDAAAASSPHRIFLVSPANAKGTRGTRLLRPGSSSPLAARLRQPEGVPIGEVFTFLSTLYFRGKAAYAERFATPPAGLPGTLVIAPGLGLRPPSHPVTLDELLDMTKVDVHEKNVRHADVLAADAARLLRDSGGTTEFVLLGSLATSKYVQPLLGVFGYRLLFPCAFVGQGDMSRGELLLRAVREGKELDYALVATSLPARGKRAREP